MAKAFGKTTDQHRRVGFTERAARAMSGLWSNKFWVLFIMLVVMAAFSWLSAIRGENSASATLALRYEQAYEGLNPNGTRFNIYELLSDSVLEKTIDRAGLTGEVSPEDLLQCLSVSASGSQKAQNMYIATEYSVRLKNDCLPQRISAESMLRLLMETYKQCFLENYGTNDSALDIDWSDVDKWEYLEFADIMDVKVNNLLTCVNDLRSESGMTQYRISGETFYSLSESISDFRSIYLDKYTSYVTVNHLFRDADGYSEKLSYRRFLAEQDRDSSLERYTVCEDALKMYDESMITFVMVPFYDSANGLYMARTSIGMDRLTENAKSYAEKLEINSKIISGFDRDLESAAAAQTDKIGSEQAERMIADIQQHLDSLIERVRMVKRDYENYRSRNSIYYTIDEPGLISGYHVRGSLAAGLAVLVLFTVYYACRDDRKRGNAL